MINPLSLFFTPRGVALIGASTNPRKLSHGILENMVRYGYKGNIYPINPSSSEILGLPSYPDISQVTGPVDLAVIILPAPAIPTVLNDCGKQAVQAVTIISGGFKETGSEGADLEKQLANIIKHYGMRMIGPNCVGTFDLYSGLNTTFIKGSPSRGGIGFISQSGAVCGGIVDYVQEKGGGFSHFISLGNETDVTETDMIEYLSEDPNTQVIAVYVEAIRDGQKFIQVAKRVNRIKPIIILKAGRSSEGAKAVSSHTGSIAGSYAAYQAAFRQSGVIAANTVADLLDLSIAFSYQPLPAGKRTVIVTNAGGPAALASDSLAENGMSLADLLPNTKARLREHLNPAAQVSNPIDMLGGAEPQDYYLALKAALSDESVDAIAAILVPQSLVNPGQVAEVIGKVSQDGKKPFVACMMGDASIKEARVVLDGYKVPMYVFPEAIGRTLGALCQYHKWKQTTPESDELKSNNINIELVNSILISSHRQTLGETDTRPILKACGIPIIPGETASSPDEAICIASKLGYPVAIKIVSPDILHKSDYGGIVLGINNPVELEAAFNNINSRVLHAKPNARLEGCLIETMSAKGQEVIIGMRRDPSFGALIMFGLGGIFVELFTDVAFRIAPISNSDTIEMIQDTKAGKMLTGFRGAIPYDVKALADCISRFAQLAFEFPMIEEMEINPLVVLPEGQGVYALDARMILSDKAIR